MELSPRRRANSGEYNTAKIKSVVRARDGYCCAECGMTDREHREHYERGLEVHRLVPGSRYTVEGCITLCRGCHGSKPKRGPGVVDQGRLKTPLLAHLVPELKMVLVRAAKSNRRTITAEIEIALENHLKAAGLWPPPPADAN